MVALRSGGIVSPGANSGAASLFDPVGPLLNPARLEVNPHPSELSCSGLERFIPLQTSGPSPTQRFPARKVLLVLLIARSPSGMLTGALGHDREALFEKREDGHTNRVGQRLPMLPAPPDRII